jgi:GT2 family glycosyltransferase
LFLRKNPVVGNIVLADGSPEADPLMEDACRKLEVQYLHAGRRLSLAEGYNTGWRSLSEPYVGLMQNDILPHPPDTMAMLLEHIKLPDVGCAFPYLTDPADYTQHIEFFRRSSRTCEPANMQLNLNIFKRHVLEEAGGVDEGYTTAFYDPILLIKIRQLGYRVVLVGGAKAIHVDQLTKKLGGSSFTYEPWKKDAQRWSEEYPQFATSDEKLETVNFCSWPLSTSLKAAILWRICFNFPSKSLRYKLWRLFMWLEPFFTGYPAKYGKTKMFSRQKADSLPQRMISKPS